VEPTKVLRGGRRPPRGESPRPETRRVQRTVRGRPRRPQSPRTRRLPGGQQRLAKPSFHWGPDRTPRLGEARDAAAPGRERGPLGEGEAGRWRTHPRPDVVHRFGAAAPAAQTPHPQHRPSPAGPRAERRLRTSLPERARSGMCVPRARGLL
jgi:hypothetical protein